MKIKKQENWRGIFTFLASVFENKIPYYRLKTETAIGRAFTLVELIVVVTILAILSTIGFVSYSSYLTWVRDTNRISNMKALSDWLELYRTKFSLPLPESSVEIRDWTTVIAWQWYAWSNVLETIEFSNGWKDPKNNTYYSYYLTKDKKYFQLMWFLEEEENLQTNNNLKIPLSIHQGTLFWASSIHLDFHPKGERISANITKQTSAVDYSILYPTVYGKKLWILTTSENLPIQEDSDVLLDLFLDISNVWTTEFKSYLKDWEYLSWTWTVFSTLTNIASAWWKFWNIVDNVFVYSSTGSVLDESSDPVVQWSDLDTNCDIADIVIGAQIWAGCNSTLWTGIERWKKDDWTNWTIDSTVGCFKDHYWTNNIDDCVIWSTDMASDTKSNTWFTWTTSNWDSAAANIWWKLYTWNNLSTACISWRHVPSDEELYDLEVALWSTDRSTDWTYAWIVNDWKSDWLGWKNHTTKTSSNNIIEALKLPLSGVRYTDSYTFYSRGSSTYLWGSSFDDYEARARCLNRALSTVLRESKSKLYAYSVRCLKD